MRSHLLLLSVSLTLLACADPLKADEDGDGVTIVDDCDDNDPSMGSILKDADCDGTVTADDCDDEDSSSLVTAEDGDCDGTLTEDDCDDEDAGSTLIAEDADCDGVLTADDCDDSDPNSHLDVDNDGYSICDGDCDDSDATAYVGVAGYESNLCTHDIDGDGYGDANAKSPLEAGTDCDDNDASLESADWDNDGYSTCEEDCDDSDATAYVGVASNEPSLCTHDADGDGYGDADATSPLKAGTDCDDSDATAYVGVASNEPSLCTHDVDGDGYGDENAVSPLEAGTDCDDNDATLESADVDSDGYSTCEEDCDDSDSTAYVGVAGNEPSLCTHDADGDGYGDENAVSPLDAGTDCDDSDSTAYVGVASNEPSLCTHDADGDGYGDENAVSPLDAGTDCDDSDSTAYVGVASLEPSLCTHDIDGDGYGDENAVSPLDAGTDCDDGDASLESADADNDGYSTCAGDCNDSDASLELDDADSDGYSTCDGDCDDSDTTDMIDADGDGYSTCDGDCDDSDASLELDDADNDGYSTCDGDCDDNDASLSCLPFTHPGGGEMSFISAGTFTMGCTTAQQADGNCVSNESPVHSVTLTHDFYMGETEVTQAEYLAIMGTNPSHYAGSDRPVESITWHEVAEYANALSVVDGLTECFTCINGTCTTLNSPYICDGYRLPTEAEWEYAARAGTDYVYAGSNTVGDVAWVLSNASSKTHPVAQKLPNDWSLYDMSGNIWEWTWDWFDSNYYSTSPTSDPEGATSGSYRVFRGGCWSNDASYARVTHRDDDTPSYHDKNLGFRLTKTINP